MDSDTRVDLPVVTPLPDKRSDSLNEGSTTRVDFAITDAGSPASSKTLRVDVAYTDCSDGFSSCNGEAGLRGGEDAVNAADDEGNGIASSKRTWVDFLFKGFKKLDAVLVRRR